MRIITTLFVLGIWCTPLLSQKVALVLSGGGAKGLAHVGVLKVLEENDIPVDYIVGTSMGGVIGGFYAAGYSADAIEQLVLSKDFQDWVSGKLGENYQFYYSKSDDHAGILNVNLNVDSSLQINTNLASDLAINFALSELLAPASQKSNYNFDSLFIPFRAIAADIFTQKVMVLKTGRLNEAIRATLSVPFFFRPMKTSDKYLFDGGIYNNFPVDVARSEFNPEVIIGVNVSSKVFDEYPYDKDLKLIQESLLTMLLDKPSLESLTEKDIYIEPNIKDYNALNFKDAAALVDSGYVEAVRHLEEINSKIKARSDCDTRTEARNEFILNSEPLNFRNLRTEGFSEPKQRYIRHYFSDKKNLNIYDIKSGYNKMISEEYFQKTYPGIVYNTADSAYDFEILGETKNSFNVDLGGNISTRSISSIFLGLNYSHFNRYLFKHRLNFYTGRFYQSMQVGSRVNIPTRSKLFYIEPVFTYNNWNFIDANELIFSDKPPTLIDLSDRSIKINLGIAAGTNGRFRLQSSYFNNSNDFSNSQAFTSADTLDQQTFTGYRFGIEYSRHNLNRKQYASSGQNFLVSLDHITAEERLEPGNTGDLSGLQQKENNWLRLKMRAEQYFGSGKYRYGYLVETVFSNQSAGFNLTGSLINAPAFEPLVDSPTLFLEQFRAYNYLAGGVRNIFGISRKMDFRLEGYFFKPFKELTNGQEDDKVVLEKASSVYLAGTAAMVYHSILGPISMQLNYYDDNENQWGVLFHIGYLLFNRKALD